MGVCVFCMQLSFAKTILSQWNAQLFVCLSPIFHLSFAAQLNEEKLKTIKTVTAAVATGIRDKMAYTHTHTHTYINIHKNKCSYPTIMRACGYFYLLC